MLTTVSIISLDQGKLYGHRIAVEDLPVPPAVPRPSLLRRVTAKLRFRKRKDPTGAGPSVGEAKLPAAATVTG